MMEGASARPVGSWSRVYFLAGRGKANSQKLCLLWMTDGAKMLLFWEAEGETYQRSLFTWLVVLLTFLSSPNAVLVPKSNGRTTR